MIQIPRSVPGAQGPQGPQQGLPGFLPQPQQTKPLGLPPTATLGEARKALTLLKIHKAIMDTAHGINTHTLYNGGGASGPDGPVPTPPLIPNPGKPGHSYPVGPYEPGEPDPGGTGPAPGWDPFNPRAIPYPPINAGYPEGRGGSNNQTGGGLPFPLTLGTPAMDPRMALLAALYRGH